MDVRLADARDVEGIVDVHLRSSSVAYAALPASVLAVSADARRIKWLEVLEEQLSRVWVAVDAGETSGFCHLRLPAGGGEPAPAAEIASLYVDPSRWGQGTGRRLIETARGTAKASGCSVVTLQVYADNQPARNFYEALGFVADEGTTVHERTGLLLVRLSHGAPIIASLRSALIDVPAGGRPSHSRVGGLRSAAVYSPGPLHVVPRSRT